MSSNKYIFNNEQAASFNTHNTERYIGKYGNEGSLNGNGNISRPMYIKKNMSVGGKKNKTLKKDKKDKKMNGGGFGFGKELKLVGHGLHPEHVKTMACEPVNKDVKQESFMNLQNGGSPSNVKASYVLVNNKKVDYPMEGVANENGVPFYEFSLKHKGENLNDFAGSYAPITSNAHSLTGGAKFLSLWKSICPGAVKIYNEELKKMDQNDPKVMSVIKNYTKVFLTEIDALKTNQIYRVKQMINSMRAGLAKARKALVSLKSKMLKTHTMIANMHIGRVLKHLSLLKQTKKIAEKAKKLRLTMRGGYHQYGSNTAHTSGYSPVMKSSSAESTPHHIEPHAGNALDNYNHYTGKTSPSPVLDQDVVSNETVTAPVGTSLF